MDAAAAAAAAVDVVSRSERRRCAVSVSLPERGSETCVGERSRPFFGGIGYGEGKGAGGE